MTTDLWGFMGGRRRGGEGGLRGVGVGEDREGLRGGGKGELRVGGEDREGLRGGEGVIKGGGAGIGRD